MMISVWVTAALVVVAAVTAGVIVWLALPEAEQPRSRERRAEYDHPDFADAAGFAVTAYPESDIILQERIWLIEDEVADVLGISQSYISRLEKRILRRLRRELESVS